MVMLGCFVCQTVSMVTPIKSGNGLEKILLIGLEFARSQLKTYGPFRFHYMLFFSATSYISRHFIQSIIVLVPT